MAITYAIFMPTRAFDVTNITGVLRAGGDTKFLMAGDILFLWVASIPLGYLAGLVFHWSSFWIYTMLKIDQIIKCVWCYYRLKSGKWLRKIRKAGEEN